MMKIFITRKIPVEAVELLQKNNYEVDIYNEDRPVPEKILFEKTQDVDGVISLLTDKLNSDIINNMQKCRVIANYAVGYNNIDMNAAVKKNIVVTNTPDILTDATADIALGLLLTCARRIIEAEKYMRDKKFTGWKPELLCGFDLKNKNFGIIGAGRIGTAAAVRAKAFGCHILYYSRSRNKDLEQQTGAVKKELDELLKESDFVSIHIPLTPETHHLLNREKLNLLKKEAILINTARGEIVDEKVLIELLKEKKIFCAGFDVYEGEPEINPELYNLSNAVLLPHIGSATIETRRDMAILCAQNIIAVLKGEKPITPVRQ